MTGDGPPGNRPWLREWPSLRVMMSKNGVGLRRLQASVRDDHGALCRYRRFIGKREPMRCGRNRADRSRGEGSEPEVLIGWFSRLGLAVTRIGIEAGPLSQWLYAGMRDAGLAVELLETRHVRDAFKAMPVKTDRKDARGIAQLMRLGCFRPVHCKSMGMQEVRAVLTARKLVQTKLLDIENSLRGILRGFGLKVGKTTNPSFGMRIRELVANH